MHVNMNYTICKPDQWNRCLWLGFPDHHWYTSNINHYLDQIHTDFKLFTEIDDLIIWNV